MRRFQAALRRLDGHPSLRGLERPRLARVAAELGYADQAHLDREFRAFTGMSPRAYRAYGVERPDHVPLRG